MDLLLQVHPLKPVEELAQVLLIRLYQQQLVVQQGLVQQGLVQQGLVQL